MTPPKTPGLFITLEGPEGSGKSTHAPRLAEYLRSLGRDVLLTREPGGTSIGDQIRSVLNDHANAAIRPSAETLLFCASRAQLVSQMIRPHLEHGGTVVCDRFSDSTLAYQGYGAGQPLEALRDLQRFAVGDLRPDLTVLIDLPVEDGLRRKQPDQVTRFEERADVEFHRRVRDGFLALAATEPDRFLVVDGRQTVEVIEDSILQAVRAGLGSRAQVSSGKVAVAPDASSQIPSEPERSSLRMNR